MVDAHRRLVLGTALGPERTAFPVDVTAHRRAVLFDLYGSGRALAADAACLDSLAAPSYVLYRAEDFAGAEPWLALDADSARFERVYEANGYRVYRRRS
jgi:hypothetical protein